MSRPSKANMAFLQLKKAVKAPYSTYSRWEMFPKLLPKNVTEADRYFLKMIYVSGEFDRFSKDFKRILISIF